MPAESRSSLDELRVLELCGGVAGAYCGKLFADYGAEVIKVEPPEGDPLRRQGPFPAAGGPQREAGAPWLYLGTNKRSITLDISQATGRRLMRRLVEDANVIVEGFSPGYLDSLGLGFEALKSIKRRIVLVSITPYGQGGPKADWRATNLTSFASGGQMSLTGEPDREPLVNGGYQAEYQAGLQAFAAAAVAAHQADATEVPQHVDISAQECMASALELYLPWWAYLKRDISKRRGNVLSGMVGIFPAADGDERGGPDDLEGVTHLAASRRDVVRLIRHPNHIVQRSLNGAGWDPGPVVSDGDTVIVSRDDYLRRDAALFTSIKRVVDERLQDGQWPKIRIHADLCLKLLLCEVFKLAARLKRRALQ
ncbi:MAG: CoA transferase, partial [Chloroflexi bacterium]|nr:CoA transferase [Chloroflexota bacterium]